MMLYASNSKKGIVALKAALRYSIGVGRCPFIVESDSDGVQILRCLFDLSLPNDRQPTRIHYLKRGKQTRRELWLRV